MMMMMNRPSDLEQYAAEYFSQLAATMDGAEAGSDECSKTRSFLEFDESMYVTGTGSDQRLDGDELGGSQKGSQRSVAESQRSQQSAASATSGEVPAKEKCPDEAEKCWEKWKQEEAEEEEEEGGIDDSAPRDSAAVDPAVSEAERASNVRGESVARESAVVGAASAEDPTRESVKGGSMMAESTVRESTAGRESSVRTGDDLESVKSETSAH